MDEERKGRKEGSRERKEEAREGETERGWIRRRPD